MPWRSWQAYSWTVSSSDPLTGVDVLGVTERVDNCPEDGAVVDAWIADKLKAASSSTHVRSGIRAGRSRDLSGRRTFPIRQPQGFALGFQA